MSCKTDIVDDDDFESFLNAAPTITAIIIMTISVLILILLSLWEIKMEFADIWYGHLVMEAWWNDAVCSMNQICRLKDFDYFVIQFPNPFIYVTR